MSLLRSGLLESLIRLAAPAIIACAIFVGVPAVADAEQNCGGAGQPMCGAVITPPATSMERPERVHVLPVFWVPPMSPAVREAMEPFFERTEANFMAHLQVTQARYRLMLRNPQTGAERGTFSLATWDKGGAGGGVARVFDPQDNELKPLIVQSASQYMDLASSTAAREMAAVGETLTAAGCKIQSCPFIFVIVLFQENDGEGGIGAIPFNYGLNGGGGHVKLNVADVYYSNERKFGVHSLQTTLLHELGHSFGLWHMDDSYVDPGDPFLHVPPGITCSSMYGTCAVVHTVYCDAMSWDRKKFAFYCSPSVMAYTVTNQVHGCAEEDPATGYCRMPTDPARIERLNPMRPTNRTYSPFDPDDHRTEPLLIPDNVYDLSRNSLVFPELAAAFDVLTDDCDAATPLAFPGCHGDQQMTFHTGFTAPTNTDHVVPGQRRVRTSGRAALGLHFKPIPPQSAAFDGETMWRSGTIQPSQWVEFWVDFPEPVTLNRIQFFTGLIENGSVDFDPSAITVWSVDRDSAGHDIGDKVVCRSSDVPAEGQLTWNPEACASNSFATGAVHRRYGFQFQARSTAVVVRGLRLFDATRGELLGPPQPGATSSDGTTNAAWASSPRMLAGENRTIESYFAPFDKSTMWQSKDVGGGEWVWVDLQFPEPVTLHSVIAYTGHTGTFNPATDVRIMTRDKHGNYVWRESEAPSSYPATRVRLVEPVEATLVRIGFLAGISGSVTVRGIRLFSGDGELFPPLAVREPSVRITYPSTIYANTAVKFEADSSSSHTNVEWRVNGLHPSQGYTTTRTLPAGSHVVRATAELFCPGFGCATLDTSVTVNVVADTIPPTIPVLPSVILEADSPSGRQFVYPELFVPAFVHDNADGPVALHCSPASGFVFPLGSTMVTCTAEDHAHNPAEKKFFVTVRDTTGPTIAPVASRDVPADSDTGAVVTYSLPATTDLADASVIATCFPGSGTVFPNGETTVTCGAEDDAGNHALPVNFTVRVLPWPTLLGKSGPVSPLVTTKARYEFDLRTTSPGDITLIGWSCGTGANAGGPSAQTDLLRLNWTFVILCRFSSTDATAVYMKFRAGNGVSREESVAVIPLADTVRPIITHVPGDVVLTQTSVAGADYVLNTSEATATDNLDPSPTITFAREPNFDGNVYPVGTTFVTFTARDSSGNPSEPKTTTVTVRHNTEPGSSAPVSASSNTTVRFKSITAPGFTTATAIVDPAEAGTLPGAFVSALFAYELSTTAGFDGLITSCFTVPQDIDADTFAALSVLHRENGGLTDVTIREPQQPAPDFETRTICASTESLSPFVIARRDTTAPTLAVDDVTVTGSDAAVPGAAATFSPTLDDNIGVVSVECAPASGSVFAFGTTEVSCTAADAAGNTTTESFTVTVLDGVAPVVTVPANITREATGANGAAVSFTATAADNVTAPVAASCSAASGGLFGVGTTTVTCTATDAAHNTGEASFTVTVVDTTAPAVAVPANITRDATGINGAVVTFASSALDTVSGSLATSCSPASGSTFAIGTTTVTCKATDAANNTGAASFTVTVEDVTTPGEMSGDGFIRTQAAKSSFEFRVIERERRDLERGRFRLNVDYTAKNKKSDRFEATDVTFIAFSDDPTIRPGRSRQPQIDTVRFSGVGSWNGTRGYRFEVLASDEGEPGRHRESVSIVVRSASGAVVAQVEGELSGGNVQSRRIHR